MYIENDIDIKTLAFLKEDMIKELIPSVGHRARFISNLDDWRSIITALPNTLSTVIILFIFIIYQPYYRVLITTHFTNTWVETSHLL